jgi:hypothetical protein
MKWPLPVTPVSPTLPSWSPGGSGGVTVRAWVPRGDVPGCPARTCGTRPASAQNPSSGDRPASPLAQAAHRQHAGI